LFPLFATGVVHNGGKFVADVIDTGGNFSTGGNFPPVSTTPVTNCHQCQQHQRYWWLNLLPVLLKKFEMILILFSGAWGKMIHEKNLKQKVL
jgi:hypothetical protein